MQEDDYSLLKEILCMEEEVLFGKLLGTLHQYYTRIYNTEHFLYALGDIPITLIAHVDTVQLTFPKTIYRDREQQVIWSPQGLGADDRAGVFAILKILEEGYRPSVIFTSGEECGGIGAHALIDSFSTPLVDTLFLVELDRQGVNEAVFYDCENKDFQRFITTNFNLEPRLGSFSDISIIGPIWDIASVNISIGYRDEHTPSEFLNYGDMFKMIDVVKNILSSHNDKLYRHEGGKMYCRKNTCLWCGQSYWTMGSLDICPSCMERYYWRE